MLLVPSVHELNGLERVELDIAIIQSLVWRVVIGEFNQLDVDVLFLEALLDILPNFFIVGHDPNFDCFVG